jgi:predicted transcriptional regulator
MQDTVLLSIRPEFVEKILSGEKLFEYRRRPFTRKCVSRMLIYATSPVCRVVGECQIDGVLSLPKPALWKSTKMQSGIS